MTHRPATCIVVHRPHQEGSRRVGQVGDDTDKLPVEIVWPVLLAMRPVPDDSHEVARVMSVTGLGRCYATVPTVATAIIGPLPDTGAVSA